MIKASGSRVGFYSNRTIWFHILYAYPLVMTFTVCHEQLHHAIKFGKPSIYKGHLYHGYVK